MTIFRSALLFSSLAFLSAQPILAGGEEKKPMKSCFRKSSSPQDSDKRVGFKRQSTATSRKQFSPVKFGVRQKDWDKYSGWDEANQTHEKSIVLRFDPQTKELVKIQEITEELKTHLAQRKGIYVDDMTIADFEWEFAFSALERVLGLSDQIDERHNSWKLYPNEETIMLLQTVAFAFGMKTDIEKADYLERYQELTGRVYHDFKKSKYYDDMAEHDVGESQRNLQHPVGEKALEKLIAARKDILISKEIYSLKTRATRGKTIIEKFLKENIFGNYDNKQAILDELENCFRDNQKPKSIFGNLEPQQRDQFKRFVIAVKEASFRFLIPDEIAFADAFDKEHYVETSEDESEDFSDFVEQEYETDDDPEINPNRIIERSSSRADNRN